MPQRLSRIELDEISLVDLPATKRKFLFKKAADRDEEGSLICECGNKEALIDFLKSASEECPNCGESLLDSATKIIFKGDNKMKKLSELLIDFIGEDELEEEEIEKFEKADKKLSPQASKALKGALNILKKFKAEFPDEVKEAINTLAKYAAYGYPAKKKEDEEEEDLEKAGAKLSKATMELIKSVVEKGKPLEKAIKALSALIQKDAGKSAEMIALEEKLDATLDKIDKLLKKKKKTKKEKKEEEEDEDEDEDKDEEEEDEDEEVEEAEKELKKLKKRIKKLEEKKGSKKSLKGQDDDEEEDEDEEKLDEDGKPIKKKKPWSFSLAKTETEE